VALQDACWPIIERFDVLLSILGGGGFDTWQNRRAWQSAYHGYHAWQSNSQSCIEVQVYLHKLQRYIHKTQNITKRQTTLHIETVMCHIMDWLAKIDTRYLISATQPVMYPQGQGTFVCVPIQGKDKNLTIRLLRTCKLQHKFYRQLDVQVYHCKKRVIEIARCKTVIQSTVIAPKVKFGSCTWFLIV